MTWLLLLLVLGQSPGGDPSTNLPSPASVPGNSADSPAIEPSGPDSENGNAVSTPENSPIGEVGVSRRHPFRAWRDPWDPAEWAKVPVLRPFPKPEYFVQLPAGEGYYSLWDRMRKLYREKPPKYPMPRVQAMPLPFYDVDWKYLEGDVPEIERDLWDRFKRIHPTDDWAISFGGEFRIRGDNIVSQFFREFDENYWINRERLYGDFWYRDAIRAYVEFISAEKHGQNDPTIFTDINKADLLNAFFDLRVDLGQTEDKTYFRIGRQELYYGSQRLISALDWANTRRTFQGVKIFERTETYDMDLFWVQPVVINTGQFDSVNADVSFAGWWNTFRPVTGITGDLYVLNLNDNADTAAGDKGKLGGRNFTTTGIRAVYDKDGWYAEGETMLQFGMWSNQAFFSQAASAGGGYTWQKIHGLPSLQAHYDFASGSSHPFAGNSNSTFQQLYPFGHYYFGYLDLVGRQNIHDISFQFAWWPTHALQFGIQSHQFYLDSPRDALYAANGKKLRQDLTGKAGRNVGEEIDITTTYHLSNHQDVLVGWSQIWSGEYIRKSGPATNPQYWYMQYSYRW